MASVAQTTARALIEAGCVAFSPGAPFTYASGKMGPVYVDVRRLLSFPEQRARVMDLAADALRAVGANVLAGGETAGIPYAAFIADRLDKPMVYVRKKPKGHGSGAGSQIEGAMEPGARAVLVEDVQNFGVSKAVFVDALRAAGAVVEDVFVIFDHGIRPEVAAENDKMGIRLHALATWWDVLAALRAAGTRAPAELDALEAYLRDPEGWRAPQG
ncbi:MAG TPA: orotate phosphoribosyltransferase [Rhodospirillaceae bacterium]|jgi:orotate phosphoribosyltransferase|nr:orotate phosphoribosyltransferase [Alphaproteobacteria bacterium]HBH26569.1 orotate phosphoribosyltransferase [Rhodospirillaceae bacterium]